MLTEDRCQGEMHGGHTLGPGGWIACGTYGAASVAVQNRYHSQLTAVILVVVSITPSRHSSSRRCA